MQSGANVVQINSGLASPAGCQFGCDNADANSFTINITGETQMSGQHSASGSISTSNCVDGATITVTLNSAARNCHFNWW